jgi:hypothetical protein
MTDPIVRAAVIRHLVPRIVRRRRTRTYVRTRWWR